MPSQVPSHPVPSPGHVPRDPAGVPVTGEHVPFEPVRLQASHFPVQSLLQHTPSAQKFDRHWAGAVHAAPTSPFGLH
jgi:hypothetical protein